MSMRQPIPKLKTHNFLERIAGAFEEMVSKSEIILEEQPKVQERAYIKYSSQVFSSLKLPTICILDYLQRVVTGGEITHTAVILALIYIDRAISMMRVFPTSYSIHRYIYIYIYIYTAVGKFSTGNEDAGGQVPDEQPVCQSRRCPLTCNNYIEIYDFHENS